MTQRTVKFLGYGTGDIPATVVATFNNTVVYSGDVITNRAEDISTIVTVIEPGDELFTCNIDMNLGGEIPFELQVEKGSVRFGDVVANYANVVVLRGNINGTFYYDIRDFNGNLETANITELYTVVRTTGPDQFNTINANIEHDVKNDKVYINGILQQVSRPPNGTWVYLVNAGETLTCNIEVAMGCESNANLGNTLISTVTGQ